MSLARGRHWSSRTFLAAALVVIVAMIAALMNTGGLDDHFHTVGVDVRSVFARLTGSSRRSHTVDGGGDGSVSRTVRLLDAMPVVLDSDVITHETGPIVRIQEVTVWLIAPGYLAEGDVAGAEHPQGADACRRYRRGGHHPPAESGVQGWIPKHTLLEVIDGCGTMSLVDVLAAHSPIFDARSSNLRERNRGRLQHRDGGGSGAPLTVILDGTSASSNAHGSTHASPLEQLVPCLRDSLQEVLRGRHSQAEGGRIPEEPIPSRRVTVWCESQSAFGPLGFVKWKIPPNTDVVMQFTVAIAEPSTSRAAPP